MIPNYDNLDQISAADIESLIGYRENGRLDFKVQLYTSEHSLAWLKDVCAFANSGGGAIVIGLSDADGTADSIRGIDADVAIDSVTRGLAQKVNSQFKPSVAIRQRVVECNNGRRVLIYAVRRSDGGPHGYYDEQRFVFWKRLETGSNAMMTHDDIRSAYAAGSDSIDRYAQIHRSDVESRIARDAEHHTGVFVSFFPFPDRGEIIQMEQHDRKHLSDCLRQNFTRVFDRPDRIRMTFDHFIVFDQDGQWVLLRRNGDIRQFCEYRSPPSPTTNQTLPSDRLLADLQQSINGHHQVAATLGIPEPWVACMSMYGFENYSLYGRREHTISESLMHFPPTLTESSLESRAATFTRWADRLWQACNEMRCDRIRRGPDVIEPDELLHTDFLRTPSSPRIPN